MDVAVPRNPHIVVHSGSEGSRIRFLLPSCLLPLLVHLYLAREIHVFMMRAKHRICNPFATVPLMFHSTISSAKVPLHGCGCTLKMLLHEIHYCHYTMYAQIGENPPFTSGACTKNWRGIKVDEYSEVFEKEMSNATALNRQTSSSWQ